jgi:hypothetical protein
MKQFLKDLPIYINGFVVTRLFMNTPISTFDVTMFVLALISFIWYGAGKRVKD